jgi:copper chaperone CopZ
VSLKAKEAVVAFDPAQVTVPEMIKAVDSLGFRASLKGSAPSAAPPTTR